MAMAEMSEAEDHLIESDPELAQAIRSERLMLEVNHAYDPRIVTFIKWMYRRLQRENNEGDTA
jgi:hypothetical protein